MGGNDASREPIVIEADEFIGIKSFKARGKRITTFDVESVDELEPTHSPEPVTPEGNDTDNDNDNHEDLDPYAGKSQQDVADELNGQLHLFE